MEYDVKNLTISWRDGMIQEVGGAYDLVRRGVARRGVRILDGALEGLEVEDTVNEGVNMVFPCNEIQKTAWDMPSSDSSK